MKRRQNVLCRNYCMLLPKKKALRPGADLSELQAIPACTEVPAVYVAPEYRIDTTDRHYGIRAHTYACFYKGTLLLAPDAQSLSAYVDALENGDVLDGTSVYEEGVGSLSPYYNFAMMVDMEE